MFLLHVVQTKFEQRKLSLSGIVRMEKFAMRKFLQYFEEVLQSSPLEYLV